MTRSEALTAALTEPSGHRFAIHLAVHLVVVLGLIGGAIQTSGPIRLLVVVGAGFALMFLFAPFHECTHRNAFNSPMTNRVTASVLGFMIFRPASVYEAFHLAHHRHTNDPDVDPELAGGLIRSRGQLAVALTGLPVHINVVGTTAAAVAGRVPGYVTERLSGRVVWEARATVGLWIALAVGSVWLRSDILLWGWILPVVVGSLFLNAALLAEHTTCSFTGRVLVDTRTTLASRPLRWLNWNSSFHTAHHAHPGVPYFLLPELNERLGDQIEEIETGYPSAYRTIWGRLAVGA